MHTSISGLGDYLAEDDRDEDDWNAFVRLGGVVALRSCVYFGLQAFVPAYFVAELAASEATGNAAAVRRGGRTVPAVVSLEIRVGEEAGTGSGVVAASSKFGGIIGAGLGTIGFFDQLAWYQ